MLPVQLEALLLRGSLPEPVLRIGAVVAARVVDRGSISIAGVVLAARLPDDAAAGETLRLRVEEATPERLLLRTVPDPPPVAALPLPGGRTARIHVEEQEAGGGEDGAPPSVTLAYESPALGRIDLRLELPPGAVAAAVSAARGEPAERVEAAADDLRQALARAAGRPAHVHLTARHDPFEAYA